MKYPMAHKIKRPFVWTSAAATDVSKTIRREQARLKAIADAEKADAAEAALKVAPLARRAAK